MRIRIPALADIENIHINDKFYLKLQPFFSKVEKYKAATDKALRKDNFVAKYKNEIVEIDGIKYCSLSSIIELCHIQSTKHSWCLKVCKQIEKLLIREQSDANDSILALYKQIANFNFKTVKQWSRILDNCALKDSPTLIDEHKCYFSAKEWDNIRLFEWHFNVINGCDLTYEQSVEKKNIFFSNLGASANLSCRILKESKQTIQRRTARRQESDHNEIKLLFNKHYHVPAKLEQQLMQCCSFMDDDFDGTIYVLDCTKRCKDKEHGAHIYFMSKPLPKSVMDEIGVLFSSFLSRKHSLQTSSICFFSANVQEKNRFRIRDLVLCDKLECLYECCVEGPAEPSGSSKCSACFGDGGNKRPLHWSNFDVEHEWLLDVPLEVQILFESFINPESIRRTTDVDAFLKSKYVRMYAIYDALLNLVNKFHFGIIQELNTSELMVNYHNLTDIFQMTQMMGITQGLCSAEVHWKTRATDELNYYNYAIRRYPLQYETECGMENHQVSLRDCFIFAMRDNLVTLTEKSNPEPGESRTGQVDTIQGTDLGVPRNSRVFLDIHEEHGCDAERAECQCNDPITLQKDDLHSTLLICSPEEAEQMRKLRQLCSWGLSKLWSHVLKDEFLSGIIQGDDNDVSSSAFNDVSEADVMQQSFSCLEILDDCLSDDDDLQDLQLAFNAISHHPIVDSTMDEADSFEDSDIENSCAEEFHKSTDIDGVEFFTLDPNTDLDQAELMQFTRYNPPPFLLFRTSPWMGRDDDPKIVESILNDLLIMGDTTDQYVVLGVDQKIGGVHMKLERSNPAFRKIIREIPPLHLLKMKILNLCSGYKDAGLLHILKYIKDDDTEVEITKMLGLNNIRSSARLIHRLALAFTLAFQIMFIQSLPDTEASELLQQVQHSTADEIAPEWDNRFETFLSEESEKCATFKMHVDMMKHSVEVVGINLAERIGGPNGYRLLRGCIKSSLLFSFLNGASSYAAYSTHLLANHSSAPILVQGLKSRFFSVPYEGSTVNFGLDTIREEEHRRAKKFFRPRSDCATVSRRMRGMEEANEMRATRERCLFQDKSSEITSEHRSNWKITDIDSKFVLRGASLILRRCSTSEDHLIPYNVYSSPPRQLSRCMIDDEAKACGEYLLYKYCCAEKLFGIVADDLAEKKGQVQGPKELVSKVLTGSSTTVKRSTCQPAKVLSQHEKETEKRRKKLGQEKKRIESLLSSQNACQAVVNPSCSKYKVMKSVTVPNAIIAAIGVAVQNTAGDCGVEELEEKMGAFTTKELPKMIKLCHENGLIMLRQKYLPEHIAKKVKVVTVENAGVHYKSGKSISKGSEFIRQFEDKWITETLTIAPATQKIIICEEKYHFTPDLFKNATRSQRKKINPSSIAHLKTNSEILSEDNFSRSSIVATKQGKQVASTFIPMNAHKLSLKKDVTIIFDSELYMEHCQCDSSCTCENFTTPLQCIFTSEGLSEQILLHNIKQRKGEAECAQIDWVLQVVPELHSGDAMLSIVSSADIDSVVLHLYALSTKMQRREDRSFEVEIYILLRKSGTFDVYNMTKMISVLEKAYESSTICSVISMALSMGGNDFLPKFQNITHLKILQHFLSNRIFREKLFVMNNIPSVDMQTYTDFIKKVFCPSSLDSESLSFEEVRQLTIKPPRVRQMPSKDVQTFTFTDGQADLRSPRLWLPPKSCLEKLCPLYDAMLHYLHGLGTHDALLPNFTDTCLATTSASDSYNLGEHAHVKSLKELIIIDEKQLIEHKKNARSKKRKLQSTPRKQSDEKRFHLSLTPLKKK